MHNSIIRIRDTCMHAAIIQDNANKVYDRLVFSVMQLLSNTKHFILLRLVT